MLYAGRNRVSEGDIHLHQGSFFLMAWKHTKWSIKWSNEWWRFEQLPHTSGLNEWDWLPGLSSLSLGAELTHSWKFKPIQKKSDPVIRGFLACHFSQYYLPQNSLVHRMDATRTLPKRKEIPAFCNSNASWEHEAHYIYLALGRQQIWLPRRTKRSLGNCTSSKH